MILDDGGDLTTLVHEKYSHYLKGRDPCDLMEAGESDKLSRYTRSL